MSFSNKRNQGFLDLGLVQEIHKMSQEYLIGPESKEVLKQTHEGPQTMMETGQRTQQPTERAPMARSRII